MKKRSRLGLAGHRPGLGVSRGRRTAVSFKVGPLVKHPVGFHGSARPVDLCDSLPINTPIPEGVSAMRRDRAGECRPGGFAANETIDCFDRDLSGLGRSTGKPSPDAFVEKE